MDISAPPSHLAPPNTNEKMGKANRPLGGVTAPSIQGASPSSKETTVTSMPPACPICQEPAIHWGRSQRAGTTEATYLCANDHGWLTKWVTP